LKRSFNVFAFADMSSSPDASRSTCNSQAASSFRNQKLDEFAGRAAHGGRRVDLI
jgi:hypothetical protein